MGQTEWTTFLAEGDRRPKRQGITIYSLGFSINYRKVSHRSAEYVFTAKKWLQVINAVRDQCGKQSTFNQHSCCTDRGHPGLVAILDGRKVYCWPGISQFSLDQ
jgi:hypothetical protein